MSLITLFTFLIPVESDERVSYSITCLLAIAVFLTLVSDNLPKTSNPMSVMCDYLMIMLIISILICLTTIINLRMYFSDDGTHVSAWCESFVRVMLCRCKARGRRERESSKLDKYMQNSSVHDKEMLQQKVSITDDMSYSNRDKYRDRRVSWKEVSYAVDRVCLLLFTVGIILVIGIFFGIMINNSW